MCETSTSGWIVNGHPAPSSRHSSTRRRATSAISRGPASDEIDRHVRTYGDEGMWFPGRRGPERPITRTNFTRYFNLARARTGCEMIDPHCLRHSFATHAVLGGVDLATVGMWLGHVNIQTTYRYYFHLVPTQSIRAASVINQALTRAA
ncbi:tyrosine-type recombinase/integrase [Nonomuraea sp. NPDC050540]|uniref:tyrosine-type recombinase/integrase n=1 Tax=Nonomuraea sp. NPDC050540 TaxID=3364367 RepID=UPI0037BA5260